MKSAGTHSSGTYGARKRSAPTGFTLLELLVVIGILAILAGMAYVGFRYVSAGPRGGATRTTLKNLQSMVTEMETRDKAGFATRVANIYTYRDSSNNVVAWNVVPTPQDVGADAADDDFGRNGDAVLRTQRVMALLMSVPANRQAIQQMPTAQLSFVHWRTGVAYLGGNVARDHVIFTDPAAPKPAYLRCTADHTSAGNPATWNAAAQTWVPATNWELDPQPVPILLDAWNHPIIFVPKFGLTGVMSAADGVYPNNAPYPTGRIVAQGLGANQPSRLFTWVSPTASSNPPPALPTNVTPYPYFTTPNGSDGTTQTPSWGGVCSPEIRPFFASAGQDGIFGYTIDTRGTADPADDIYLPGGDDNVYSFQD